MPQQQQAGAKTGQMDLSDLFGSDTTFTDDDLREELKKNWGDVKGDGMSGKSQAPQSSRPPARTPNNINNSSMTAGRPGGGDKGPGVLSSINSRLDGFFSHWGNGTQRVKVSSGGNHLSLLIVTLWLMVLCVAIWLWGASSSFEVLRQLGVRLDNDSKNLANYIVWPALIGASLFEFWFIPVRIPEGLVEWFFTAMWFVIAGLDMGSNYTKFLQTTNSWQQTSFFIWPKFRLDGMWQVLIGIVLSALIALILEPAFRYLLAQFKGVLPKQSPSKGRF